jgi:uncharacterized protein (TIGR03905 family)
MNHRYATKNTCSTAITFELDGGRVRNIAFTDGCNGNLKGLAVLADGMDAHELVKKLKGLRCGRKHTSCPDQLAAAVEQALAGAGAGAEPAG